jgi:ABC-type glycerol-3-phosphate transport system substrate-binding protein
MKKVFLTLAVVLATSTVLVSCGGKKDETASPTATPAEAGKETETESEGNGSDTTKVVVEDTTKKATDVKTPAAPAKDGAKKEDAKKPM